MEKREKILLGVMAVIALGGGVVLLMDESKPPAAVPAAQGGKSANDLAAATQKTINEHALRPDERYILENAIREWRAAPFYDWELAGQASAEGRAMAEEAAKYAYTGYIEVGGKAIAVINGLEYQTGEELVTGGLLVRSIDKMNVVLQSSGKSGATLTLPYAGEVY